MERKWRVGVVLTLVVIFFVLWLIRYLQTGKII